MDRLCRRLVRKNNAPYWLKSCRFASFAGSNLLAGVEASYAAAAALAARAYAATKPQVDETYKQVLHENPTVLFLEGSVDAPRSELSLNVVKILTQIQTIPLYTVNVLEHPAILGFALSESKQPRCPVIFVNGRYYGNHDTLLEAYLNNPQSLENDMVTISKVNNPIFGDVLPPPLW
eukprot:Platyproteum_vivax@DN2685_c0_g1_i1.p1